MNCAAKYCDGKRAVVNSVELHMTEEYLTIKLENGEVNKIPYSELIILDVKNELVFGRKDDIGMRIIIEDKECYNSLLERIPKNELFLSSLHNQHKLALFLLIVIVLVIFTVDMSLRKFSGELAQLVPERILKDAGEQILNSIEAQHKVCNAGAGLGALKKLKKSLLIKDEINIVVVEDPQVNALALPGNTIVILSGLIDKVTDEAEIYGVLAHEIAHIKKNHASRAIVESVGMYIILGGLGGQSDVKLSNDVVGELLTLKNSREFEDEADKEALNILQNAKLTNKGLLKFLKSMDGNDGVAEFLSTHPSDKKRVMVIESSDEKVSERPILNPAEWSSLKRICE